jgi:protein-tyrosine phosphatase
MPSSILFVCTGNICRSPTADGIMRHFASNMPHLNIDSAGTHAYHIGEAPDSRTQQVAIQRGYDLSTLRARKIAQDDFYTFDVILAMDRGHLEALKRLRPDGSNAELALFLEYAGLGSLDVLDPYYGDMEGFEHVLDVIENASKRIYQALTGVYRV